MNCFISELCIPEDSGGLFWQCCQRCRRRKDCPYAHDQALHRAARQGHTTAQLLAAEADRLQETISRADNVHSLLSADEVLERALAHVLHSVTGEISIGYPPF